MRGLTNEQRKEAERLGDKSLQCAALCAELAEVDRADSPIARETDYLSELLINVARAHDNGRVRSAAVLRLVNVILAIQEESLGERKQQLERSANE